MHKKLAGTIAIISGVGLVFLLSYLIFHVSRNNIAQTSNSSLVSSYPPCATQPAHSYMFTITSMGFVPVQITAHRCDQLVFLNDKSDQASPAFGPHVDHYDYPGFKELVLEPKQSNTLRLYQTGTFSVHDHFDDGLRASITIKN